MSERVTSHGFTSRIESVLANFFGDDAQTVFENSSLLIYINNKTKAASKGSKSRGSFANLYALYVLVEDYVLKGYCFEDSNKGLYHEYEGARFSELLVRQRQLPFGRKLQNHALNGRLNDEFRKFNPALGKVPIVRDVEKQRYWVQEDLLHVHVPSKAGNRVVFCIARAILEIINLYVDAKREAFEAFLVSCRKISELPRSNDKDAIEFIESQVRQEVDARVFEIVSFAILKEYYGDKHVYFGWTKQLVKEHSLELYKTGRTNANDGGIDFVMRPLGRFFQVTETTDVTKYFLDIDKIQRFPITFVVKSNKSSEEIRSEIQAQAIEKYRIIKVVESYMRAIEEIINIPMLMEFLRKIVDAGRIRNVMEEISVQSKVEFNHMEEDSE